MKIVIQSHKEYNVHLKKLLKSMNLSNKEDNIIIVYGGENKEQIYKRDIFTYIDMKENIWEYTSFLAIYRYIDHPDVTDSTYLFLHDTCWVGTANIFWDRIEQINKDITSKDIDFMYPSTHIKKNIGVASKELVLNFGVFLNKYANFDKKHAVYLESYIPKNFKIDNKPGYKTFGKQQINGKIRRLHYFPYIDLYKHNGFGKGYNNVTLQKKCKISIKFVIISISLLCILFYLLYKLIYSTQ